jgi:anti-anti-sigma factor
MIRAVSYVLPFQLVERGDSDGALRITLIGELDLAVADQLSARLEQLRGDRIPVRLDLSRLDFIDSSGLRTLIRAAQSGARDGQGLIEVERELTPAVQKVIAIVDAARVLWPPSGSRDGSTF